MRSHADIRGINSARDALESWLALVRRADWRRLAFYLGVPSLLALYSATMDLYAITAEGIWPTLRFYIAHAFVPWWITCLATRALFIGLARFRLSAPALWVGGAFLSCLVMIPYMNWIGMEIGSGAAASTAAVTVGQFVLHLARVTVIWVLVNYFFERFVGLPRYRYSHSRVPEASAKIPPEPAQMKSLSVVQADQANVNPALKTKGGRTDVPEFLLKSGKLTKAEELFSVSAEEHYIRVHTSNGDALIYKRFSDAVKELSAINGIRIHRSHWVSPYAVAGIKRDGKRMFVRLRDGSSLPVSRPYQSMVRELARSCGH